ncbi:MAG: hypothetical protein AAGB22_12840, partial [Bacteroidota bacterium]
MPLLLLAGMVFHPLEVSPILFTHLILFRSGPVRILRAAGEKMMPVFQRWQHWLTDYALYRTGLWRHGLAFLAYLVPFLAGHFLLRNLLDADNFLHYQRFWSRLLVVVMLLHVSWVVRQRLTATRTMVRQFLCTPGSAYNLALLRIVFMYYLSLTLNWQTESFTSWTHLPDTAREPLPFMGWFIDGLPITPEVYAICLQVCVALAFLAAIGIFTRPALLLYTLLAIYVWGVPNFFGKLNHNHVAVWIPAILALSRCGDVLSVDWLGRKLLRWPRKQALPALDIHYGLPMKLVWLTLAGIYFFSGLHKLWDTGLAWALSESMVNQLHWEWVEHYDHLPKFRLDRYPALVEAGGLAVLFGELFYPLLIFGAWLRTGAFLSGQALHRITGHFLYIDFVLLRHLSFFYINWHWLFLRL